MIVINSNLFENKKYLIKFLHFYLAKKKQSYRLLLIYLFLLTYKPVWETNLVVIYASRPSGPPSEPYPESLTPPKGVSTSPKPWWLIETWPLSIAWPKSWAVFAEFV